MILYTILILVFIIIKLVKDTKKRKAGVIINHSFSALIDTTLYWLTATVVGLFTYWPVDNWLFLKLTFFGLSMRWLFFDLLFSKVNYQVWEYYGTSSVMDKYCTMIKNKIGSAIHIKAFLLVLTLIIALAHVTAN